LGSGVEFCYLIKFLLTGMNKQSFNFLIILAVLAMVVWFFIYPAWQGVAQSRQDLIFWQKKIVEIEEARQKYFEFKTEYELLRAEETKIMNALPEEGDLPGLLVQLEALASRNGLILNSINFIYPEKSIQSAMPAYGYDGEESAAISASGSKAQSSSLANAKTLTIDIGLSGNFTALRNFLREIENNLRLTDVDNISFSSASAGQEITGSSGKLSIKLMVYYKEKINR